MTIPGYYGVSTAKKRLGGLRIGATSYVMPCSLLENVQNLAGRVDDIELILFDLAGGWSNLPSERDVAELKRLALAHGHTYTVHLPMDIHFVGSVAENCSLAKAKLVIGCTLALKPWAYVTHLEAKGIRSTRDSAKLRKWEKQARRALDFVSALAGDSRLIAVENLDGHPPELVENISSQTGCSRCVDIGHLWHDKHDPLPFLERAAKQLRVIHCHGVAGRDHASLARQDRRQLEQVIGWCERQRFGGVFTIEVFSDAEYQESLKAIEEARDALAKDRKEGSTKKT